MGKVEFVKSEKGGVGACRVGVEHDLLVVILVQVGFQWSSRPRRKINIWARVVVIRMHAVRMERG